MLNKGRQALVTPRYQRLGCDYGARAYAVRYVMSFGASATAVPLIAWVHRTYGDFQPLFAILAAVAVLTLVAALAFPMRHGRLRA
jgi:hypothetical protein